jgi:hypothetical protein
VQQGLQQVIDSRAATFDDARPQAVAQQRKRDRWMACEAICEAPELPKQAVCLQLDRFLMRHRFFGL